MYAHRTTYSLAAVTLFAAALLGLAVRGGRSRAFSPARTTRVVASRAEAARIWEEEKVRGRILVLFDAYPHELAFPPRPGEPPPPSDLVRLGIARNVVRRIYLVVPEAGWAAFERMRATYRAFREVPGAPEALYLFTYSGVPLIAATPSSLPALDEDALVYVDEDVFDLREATALLARSGIGSDLLVARRRGARE